MATIEDLKNSVKAAARSVDVLRADLSTAENELRALRISLAAAIDEEKKAAVIASARSRCGPVVVA